LTACDDCRRLEQRVQLLRTALRNNAPAYRAPARLRKNVRRALKREAKPERESFSPWLVLTTGAAFALLLLSFAFYQTTRTSHNVIADELVANHVRSRRDPPGRRGLVRPAPVTVFHGKVDLLPKCVICLRRVSRSAGASITSVARRSLRCLPVEQTSLFVRRAHLDERQHHAFYSTHRLQSRALDA
jgi:hypothetical protein